MAAFGSEVEAARVDDDEGARVEEVARVDEDTRVDEGAKVHKGAEVDQGNPHVLWQVYFGPL